MHSELTNDEKFTSRIALGDRKIAAMKFMLEMFSITLHYLHFIFITVPLNDT